MRKLAKTSVDYVEGMKDDNNLYVQYLRKNATIINHYEMLADLYDWNEDFGNSTWFRYEKRQIIRAYVNRLRTGKITIDGDNLTIFGNPYALLLKSVGEDPETDPTINVEPGTIQCYTKRFQDKPVVTEAVESVNRRKKKRK